jgi:hypothetical protein
MGCALRNICIALLLAGVGTVSGIGIAEAETAGDWYTKPDWWVAISTSVLWVFTALLWWTTKKAVADGEKAVETANAAVVAANRHAAETARGAQAMANVAVAMDEQRSIMASQRDLSSAMQRAWVSVDVKIAGPMTVDDNEMISGPLTLQIRNNGTLPAFVDRAMVAAHPWDMSSTSRDPFITGQIKKDVAEPLVPHGVIFPQQEVSERRPYGLQKSQMIGITQNLMVGFVVVIRGVIKYAYPGDSAVHYTTFHVHIVRVPDPTAPTEWRPLPIESGALVPAAELFVTHELGRTEAT